MVRIGRNGVHRADSLINQRRSIASFANKLFEALVQPDNAIEHTTQGVGLVLNVNLHLNNLLELPIEPVEAIVDLVHPIEWRIVIGRSMRLLPPFRNSPILSGSSILRRFIDGKFRW